MRQGALVGAAILALVLPPLRSDPGKGFSQVVTPQLQQVPRYADFAGESASADVLYVANWVVDAGDNRQLFFVVIDKKNAKVFVFSPLGKLLGATPVLIGAAKGDDSVVGIGGRPISEVLPHERTTPAGRFVGEPGRNSSNEDVVWVDYDAAVSMHRVRTLEPKERRLERLASPNTEDHRISYGCINVPVKFFENVVKMAFNGHYGVVYVLPEVKTVGEVFTSAYDVAKKYVAIPPG